jgi:hypothetical protein
MKKRGEPKGKLERKKQTKKQSKRSSSFSRTRIDALFQETTHILAGIFCASLEQMQESLTASSAFSFQPKNIVENVTSQNKINPALFRYRFLPHSVPFLPLHLFLLFLSLSQFTSS